LKNIFIFIEIIFSNIKIIFLGSHYFTEFAPIEHKNSQILNFKSNFLNSSLENFDNFTKFTIAEFINVSFQNSSNQILKTICLIIPLFLYE
jgi:hypothetical protein